MTRIHILQSALNSEWYSSSLCILLIEDGTTRINQYFDGKCSDDEILYKADISRKQLREVLHHYEEYVSSSLRYEAFLTNYVNQLQLFLHPS